MFLLMFIFSELYIYKIMFETINQYVQNLNRQLVICVYKKKKNRTETRTKNKTSRNQSQPYNGHSANIA